MDTAGPWLLHLSKMPEEDAVRQGTGKPFKLAWPARIVCVSYCHASSVPPQEGAARLDRSHAIARDFVKGAGGSPMGNVALHARCLLTHGALFAVKLSVH